jgi:APA family basic amino acid/polyamine antiporter
MRRLLAKKSLAQIQAEAESHTLQRVLGPMNLVSMGVGAIIGAGIFTLVGQAAAANAGPGVVFSFLLAAAVCAFVGVCYAELASCLPVAGSAYTYAYGVLGEGFAWTIGWLLVLEYGIGTAMVAVSWSSYLVDLLGDFGLHFPRSAVPGGFAPAWATPTFDSVTDADGNTRVYFTGQVNLLAALGMLGAGALLIFGVRESARINNIMVAVKLIVLTGFIAVGAFFVRPELWIAAPGSAVPLIPVNTSHVFGQFGWTGVLRASAVIFFAYMGFETVSTAALEARNPQKHMPVGILGSLLVCTVFYVATALVLTGLVPYRQLGVADPIAVAVNVIRPVWAQVPLAFGPRTLNLFSFAIKVGAVGGLSSVMLVYCYGQSRIFYAMSGDGLLPGVFSKIHPRFRTPWIGLICISGALAVSAALLPLALLGDLVSLGTALAFAMVCVSVIYLRIVQPDLPRPYRAPGGVVTAGVGAVLCLGLGGFNLWPMIDRAVRHGDFLPLGIVGAYLAAGIAIYFAYGIRHSHLQRATCEAVG